MKSLRPILLSLVSVSLSLALMVVGTFALFTDSVTVSNHLQAGTLKITLVRTAHSYSTLDDDGILKTTAVATESVSANGIIRLFFGLIACVLFFYALSVFEPTVPATAFAEDKHLISSVEELVSALTNANDGETVFVDDITFDPMPNGSVMVSRNVTIKSGKDSKAVFDNCTFVLNGSTATPLTVRFENIDFRGDQAGKPVDLDSPPVTVAKKKEDLYKTMCAGLFSGNVNAVYEKCSFDGYHYGYGGALSAIYSNVDNKNNCLNLSLIDCSFKNNAAKYGGDLYLSGYNRNISLVARHCVFSDGVASTGGAVWAQDCELRFLDCAFENNRFLATSPNEVNGGALALFDCITELDGCLISNNVSGGNGAAVFCEITPFRTLVMKNCFVIGNTSPTDEGIHIELGTTNYDAKALAHIYFSTIFGKQSFADSAELFGCLFVGDNCGFSVPSEDAFCMELSTQSAESIGLKNDSTEHVRLPKGEYPIPKETLNAVAGGKFANSLGVLQIGDNYLKETVIELDYSSKRKEYLTVRYGDEISVEQLEKDGYSFTGWAFPEGTALLSGSVFMGGELPDTRAVAQWRFEISQNLYVIWAPAVVIAVLAVALFFLFKNRKSKRGTLVSETAVGSIGTETDSERPFVVKAWFTTEEIDKIVCGLPKIQMLTRRETEVFTEMLEGKKQKEIAYDLGIEITTVKDFYRKIYDKLDYPNKETLFKGCSEFVANPCV